jgi:hypothetical protein
MKTTAVLCVLAANIGALLLPGIAIGSSESGQGYAARVEPICKAGTPVIETLLHGTRRMASHGQAVFAGRRFVRASNAFGAMVRKVKRVKRPATYAARIGKWVERLGHVKEGLRRVGLALKHRDRLEALNRVGQLRDAGTYANRAVAGFHLHYCRIYESRFS